MRRGSYAVLAGMLAATLIGVFLIPVLFVVVERIANRGAQPHLPAAPEALDEEA